MATNGDFGKLLNIDETCRYLGITRDIFAELRKAEDFPAPRYRNNYFSKLQIDRWLDPDPTPETPGVVPVDEFLQDFFPGGIVSAGSSEGPPQFPQSPNEAGTRF